MEPASGTDIYLRLIEQPAHPDFVPLRSYGWAAIEICVEDVLAANERILESPFEVIGPPREIDGLPAIYPMQVRGPDQEIVYLTQIREDLPEFDLPRAEAPIDRLFILVLACSDMHASLDWIEERIGFALEAGCSGVLVNAMPVGLPTLRAVRNGGEAFVLAHPAAPVALVGSMDPGRLAASPAALGVQLAREDAYAILQASE